MEDLLLRRSAIEICIENVSIYRQKRANHELINMKESISIEVEAAMQTQKLSETDPRHHTIKIKGLLNDVINHLREDVKKVEEPRAQALFETTAEVLNGLMTAYKHYEQHSEQAWK